MTDYSHHVFAYLIWRCLRAGITPALRLDTIH
jgi:hypothetical protein